MEGNISYDVYNSLDIELQRACRELLMPVDTDIMIDSVILSKENRDKLDQFLIETRFREEFVKNKLFPMNRLLFYGASGTGKTYLSKALSNHLGYTMLYVDIAKSLTDSTISKNIASIFKIADKIRQCIIFFDEADSIAWNREGASNEIVRLATNSVFQHLDQMHYSNIFIAATNLLHRLDPAFERRFSMKFEFRKPELNIKDTIRRFLFDNFELVDDVDKDIEAIVTLRMSLSYYEIQGIVERAMKKAIIEGHKQVRTSDLFENFAIALRISIRL